MKVAITCLLMLGLAASALALDKAELDQRIRKLTLKFDTLQAKPDKKVPADMLKKAVGIVLLDRTKAGFIFAYQGGTGVAMVRDSKSGQWTAPAFMKAGQASLGVQVGGQQSFVVVLIMHTNLLDRLTQPTWDFGGEAQGTAGNATGKESGSFTDDAENLLLAYSDVEGLYGGAALKGGSVSPDNDANLLYYGEFLTTKDILFNKKPKASEAAAQLIQRLNDAAKSKG